mmetsp:Transcript_42933/g.99439  ORF Transcript_42933/g.99439 Transcript_42933/m.99439 type:complete len:95 (+) Transcript_42933:538-822(+)
MAISSAGVQWLVVGSDVAAATVALSGCRVLTPRSPGMGPPGPWVGVVALFVAASLAWADASNAKSAVIERQRAMTANRCELAVVHRVWELKLEP